MHFCLLFGRNVYIWLKLLSHASVNQEKLVGMISLHKTNKFLCFFFSPSQCQYFPVPLPIPSPMLLSADLSLCSVCLPFTPSYIKLILSNRFPLRLNHHLLHPVISSARLSTVMFCTGLIFILLCNNKDVVKYCSGI